MNYIELIGFIATMVSLMLSLLEQKTFGRWFGYVTNSIVTDTVFNGRSFMAIGRLCNYSLVRLRWLFIIHVMVIVTMLLQLTLLIPIFCLSTIPYYDGSIKELLQDYFAGREVIAIFVRDGTSRQDLFYVNILIFFYFVPLLICMCKAIYDVSKSAGRPDGFQTDRDEFIAYVLFTAGYSFMLTVGYVLLYSFHAIAFFITITLVYGVVSQFIYKKYYSIFKSDVAIVVIDSSVIQKLSLKQQSSQMFLYLKDGTVIDSSSTLFYPILGEEKNDIFVLFKDSDRILYPNEISKLEVRSNIVCKLNFPFIRQKVVSENIVKVYDFD